MRKCDMNTYSVEVGNSVVLCAIEEEQEEEEKM
jgi:hypothetical protein